MIRNTGARFNSQERLNRATYAVSPWGLPETLWVEGVGSRPGSEAAESAGIQPIKEPAAASLEGKAFKTGKAVSVVAEGSAPSQGRRSDPDCEGLNVRFSLSRVSFLSSVHR